MNIYNNPIEVVKYITKGLLSRNEVFEISLDRGFGGPMKIEKWILIEMVSKLVELKNKNYIDLFEGEHKYPIMKSTRFEHCDIWWKCKDKEHWIEVKTLILNQRPTSNDIKCIKDDIDKVNRLIKPYAFHSLVFALSINKYDYECAKQSLAISIGEIPIWEKVSHHPITEDLRAFW